VRLRTSGYRRRRPWPAAIILLMLLVAATTVWVSVIGRVTNPNAVASCPTPATPPSAAGQQTPLPYSALHAVTPAPPQDVSIRVLNAGGQRSLASHVAITAQLFGFTLAAPPANDPLYPQGNLRCVGEIVFGPNGLAAARTLSLVAPCAQLVRDDRQTGTVDLVLGEHFASLSADPAAHTVLNQLTHWAKRHPLPTGGLQAYPDLAPQISPALLDRAHSTVC
jgi:hypothetical protein